MSKKPYLDYAFKAASRRRYKRSPTIKRQCFERDNYQCQRCGDNEDIECHHIVPLHKGGVDIPTNTMTLCKHCHKLLTDLQQSKRAQINPLTGLRYGA